MGLVYEEIKKVFPNACADNYEKRLNIDDNNKDEYDYIKNGIDIDEDKNVI